MKFEDIKVGDTVMIEADVRYGWRESKSFWVPANVTKVTPKRFFIGEYNQFRKDDGVKVGDGYAAARSIGDVYNDWGKQVTVTDQSVEMAEFKDLVNKWLSVNTFSIKNLAIDNKSIAKIYDAIKVIESLISEGEV